MPTYVYKCTDEHEFEAVQSIHEHALIRCWCGMNCHRVIQTSVVRFRGPGFASTDE